MKRPFRPIFLAAICWMSVALVPATRNGLLRAEKPRLQAASDVPTPVDGFPTPSDFQREAARRFPGDRRVQLDALFHSLRDATPQSMETVARKWSDDPTATTILLRAQLNQLKSDRNEGVLSNPGGPGAPVKKLPGGTSPRAKYDRFIALARRGQKLEPNNTFFDWMEIYGLFATRRDEQARAALKIAARKTDFDDHSRDTILNRLAVMRMVYGAPLSPSDLGSAWSALANPEYGKMRQTARWVTEGAIADRSAKRHNRALDAAFDLTKLGRVMRRESHFMIGSLVGTAIQGISISRIIAPLPLSARVAPRPRSPRFGAPLSAYQASPISLYAYAKSRYRTDITRFLDREWPEIGKWRAMNKVISNQGWTGNSTLQTFVLTAAERARILILRALPSVLILGAIFAWLSRRFRDESGAMLGGFWRGAGASVVLLVLALLADATITLQNPPDDYFFWPDTYFEEQGLLSIFPFWVSVGFASVAILLALSVAIRWQKRQFQPHIPIKARFKTLFDAPEDGLMRFDFSWIFAIVTKTTGWALLLLGFVNLCFNHVWWEGVSGLAISTLGLGLLIGTLLICLFLHYASWRTKPRRAATFRLGLRLISQSLLGFFVASSVLYALIAFAVLPLAFRFERNFQNAIERGEVQIARAKLGI